MIKNKFPIDIFPQQLIDLIQSSKESLNYPEEYTASCLIAAFSSAMGNSFHAKFKQGFHVRGNLFMCLVGNPGDVKSHPLKMAFLPLEKTDDKQYTSYKEDLETYNALTKEERERSKTPTYIKTIVKDFTPESLMSSHDDNKRGIAIVVDELMGFFKNIGRYSQSGEQELYLSLWSGDSVSVDRKSSKPIRISNPFVNIIGTTQTKVLSKLASNNRGENGFMERILFVFNSNSKPLKWTEMELKKGVLDRYFSYINRTLALPFKDDDITIIEFDEGAKQAIMEWQNLKREEFFGDDIATSFQSKIEVYTLRFSLILHTIYKVVQDRDKDQIDFFIAQQAIKLSEYYFENSLRAYDLINNINPSEILNPEQSNWYNSLPQEFETKVAQSIGMQLDISERTISRLLKNKDLFKKVRHGVYTKLH